MKLGCYGFVATLALGCATHAFRQPYVWHDEAKPVGARRADVALAEARVLEFLASDGQFSPVESDCKTSARAYQVVTAETATAFEVSVIHRPGLCSQAPEELTLPPVPLGTERALQFAVRKTDLAILRERLPGDAISEPVEPPKDDASAPAPIRAPSLPFAPPDATHICVPPM